MNKHLATLLFAIVFLVIASASADETKPLVPVYVYHQQPPFIVNIEKKQGLYFDFVRRLNALNDEYLFKVTYVPRKRVERMLESHSMNAVLLGVNPTWFKDKEETKYLWTTVILNDRDEVVSLKTESIEFSGADSLVGVTLGGVRGYYYYGINELVSAKKIRRVDTVGEAELFSMLLKERVEAAIIGKRTFDYMVSRNDWQNNFYLSAKPHDVFERRILVPQNMAMIYPYLQGIIDQLVRDKAWQEMIANYQ